MRRIVFAPSFDRDVEDIAVYIDERFGEAARHEFIADLMAVCALIASFPGIGKTDHHYTTELAGFPFNQNWIFFEVDLDEARFFRIVPSHRHSSSIRF